MEWMGELSPVLAEDESEEPPEGPVCAIDVDMVSD